MDHILIIADQTRKKPVAVNRGIELARKLGAKVTVLGFAYEDLGVLVEVSEDIDETFIKKSIMTGWEKHLKDTLAAVDTKGIKVKREVVWEKHLAAWVVNYCKKTAVDIVIKSRHASENLIYTSTDWQLLRECSAPVLLISEKKWRKSRGILAAVDLATKHKPKQRLNDLVLGVADTLSVEMDMKLHLVDVVPVSTVLRDLDIIDVPTSTKNARKVLKEKAHKLLDTYNLHKENVHIKAGEVERVIAGVSSKVKADIVVLGTTGRKGMKGKLIGNTAEKVLNAHVASDVLVVK